jgi:uncharacterized membrane protein
MATIDNTGLTPELSSPPNLDDLKNLRITLKNVHEEVHEDLTSMDKLALWITNHVGSMGFFFLILVWTIFWLGWNFLAPDEYLLISTAK